MTWWQAALLGLIQGLTEFLPVSSSGHLVLGQYLLGIDAEAGAGITFDVFVHFGTVLSILTVYRKRVGALIADSLGALARPGAFAESYREQENVRLVVYILLTLIPTGIVYLLFDEQLEALFEEPRLVAGALLFTGVLLLLTLLRPSPDGRLTVGKALLVGFAQSLAMIPGISRSGSTICAAIYQNVEPKKAADFSFLMLLPVVIGATLFQLDEVSFDGERLLPLVIGTLVAYATGVAAIKVMIGFVTRGNLHYFAYYLFVVGALGLIFI